MFRREIRPGSNEDRPGLQVQRDGPACLGRRRRSCVNPVCFRSAVGNPSPYNFVVLMFSVAFGFIAGFRFDSVFKKLESDHNGSLPPRSALWAKTVA